MRVYVGKTLLAQVMEFVPWTSFARIVQRHGGNAGVRSLSCAEQFRAMAFAQLTWRESLRDIQASLSANSAKLYAMGSRSAVKNAVKTQVWCAVAIASSSFPTPPPCFRPAGVSVASGKGPGLVAQCVPIPHPAAPRNAGGRLTWIKRREDGGEDRFFSNALFPSRRHPEHGNTGAERSARGA